MNVFQYSMMAMFVVVSAIGCDENNPSSQTPINMSRHYTNNNDNISKADISHDVDLVEAGYNLFDELSDLHNQIAQSVIASFAFDETENMMWKIELAEDAEGKNGVSVYAVSVYELKEKLTEQRVGITTNYSSYFYVESGTVQKLDDHSYDTPLIIEFEK